MAIRLRAVTYKYAGGGGCVDLEEIGDIQSVEIASGKRSPVALRRSAAARLRDIADTLDQEADKLSIRSSKK